MTRWGSSRTEAESRLLIALADHATVPAGDWAGGMRVTDAISLWRSDLEASSLAPASRQIYQAAARLYVQPALGGVRLSELTSAVINRALNLVRVNKGAQPSPGRPSGAVACAPTPCDTARSLTIPSGTSAPSAATTVRPGH